MSIFQCDRLVPTVVPLSLDNRNSVFVRVLGDVVTKGGKSTREIRPYDFRHSAACYWRNRYKSVNAYMYRFGWKEMKMVHY
jgi:integrase